MSTSQAGGWATKAELPLLIFRPLWFIVSDTQASVVAAVHPVIPALQRGLVIKELKSKPHWRFNKAQKFKEYWDLKSLGFHRTEGAWTGSLETMRSGSYLGLSKATNRPRIWQIHSALVWSAESVSGTSEDSAWTFRAAKKNCRAAGR